MAENSSLEQRLADLEREVSSIKARLVSPPKDSNWVDQISGSMKDFPEFQEVVRLGRQFRESAPSHDPR